MGKIEKILKKGPVEGQTTEVYPVTSTKAVYDENNKRLDNIITGLQESVYLNIPIPISTDNTTESHAQNVKNIADYVEKAKAAGIADVNGMAVTCLIDNNYSGVGYLYSCDGAPIWVMGIITYDDFGTSPTVFIVDGEGLCIEREVVMKDMFDQVTSEMLVQGARKPIILTPSTTEVDEETYQKLLSDDVDVLFKDANDSFGTLTCKLDSDTTWEFYFSSLVCENSEKLYDTYFYAYKVAITKIGISHKCEVTDLSGVSQFDLILINNGFIDKTTLNPILQEINLTGTDEERKAKLDQFARNWKTLTGADTLDGARFVGYVDAEGGLEKSVIFSYNTANDYWSGVNSSSDGITSVMINTNRGSITVTPLFSHLEAIAIETSNSSASKVNNINNLQSYIDNLGKLGVADTLGIEIPIWIKGGGDSYGILVGDEHTGRFKGFAYYINTPVAISISSDGTVTTLNLQTQVDTTMSDTSTNPVQNKVIKAYIDGLVGNVAAQLAQI